MLWLNPSCKRNKPVYTGLPPISLEFHECKKCESIDGGIYGKGPLKHYRTTSGLKCNHQWHQISEKNFALKAKSIFNINWANDPMPFWQKLAKY